MSEIMGGAGTLEEMFTEFWRNDIFAVGVDATHPSFPDGAVMLFSGDDEFYRQATDFLPRAEVEDLLDCLEEAESKVESVCAAKGRKLLLRSLNRHPLPDDLKVSSGKVGGHGGLLAMSGSFAALMTPLDDVPSVNLLHADGDRWSVILSFHPAWLSGMAMTARRARQDGPGAGIDTFGRSHP